jgi:hypothetical protein
LRDPFSRPGRHAGIQDIIGLGAQGSAPAHEIVLADPSGPLEKCDALIVARRVRLFLQRGQRWITRRHRISKSRKGDLGMYLEAPSLETRRHDPIQVTQLLE